MKRRYDKQRGFSIVEVLVALVVMAVGMLGVAALYATTLQAGGGAIYRMQAVNLASDMGDRIRANPTASATYAANAGVDNTCAGAAAVDCTPAEMAENDILIWQAQVAATLPSGTGTVAVAGVAAPFTYTITVSWQEPGQDDPLTYAMTMTLERA